MAHYRYDRTFAFYVAPEQGVNYLYAVVDQDQPRTVVSVDNRRDLEKAIAAARTYAHNLLWQTAAMKVALKEGGLALVKALLDNEDQLRAFENQHQNAITSEFWSVL